MHSAIQVPTGGGPFVVVTYVIPTSHVDVVGKAVADALMGPPPGDGPTGVASHFTPPHPRTYGPKGKNGAWRLDEWVDPGDEPAIHWAVSTYDELEQRTLRILWDLQGEFIATGDLLPAAGYGPDQKASPIFKHMAGACRANARKPFWDGKAGGSNGRLLHISMERDAMRRLLGEALMALGV